MSNIFQPIFPRFVCVLPLILFHRWIFHVVWWKCYLNSKIRSVWDVTARQSFQFVLSCSWKLLVKALGRGLTCDKRESKGFEMKFHDLIVNSLTVASAVWHFLNLNSSRQKHFSSVSLEIFYFHCWNIFTRCKRNWKQRAIR